MPLDFGNAIFNGNLRDIPLSSGQRSIGRWFNADAGFERAAARQLGSNIRYMPSRFSGIRGDGVDTWDLSVIKNTYFSSPNTAPASTAFGTVTETAQMPPLLSLATGATGS